MLTLHSPETDYQGDPQTRVSRDRTQNDACKLVHEAPHSRYEVKGVIHPLLPNSALMKTKPDQGGYYASHPWIDQKNERVTHLRTSISGSTESHSASSTK